MELHTQTRNIMNPDPEYDCIQGIFYNIYNMTKGNQSITGKELNYIKFFIIYKIKFFRLYVGKQNKLFDWIFTFQTRNYSL